MDWPVPISVLPNDTWFGTVVTNENLRYVLREMHPGSTREVMEKRFKHLTRINIFLSTRNVSNYTINMLSLDLDISKDKWNNLSHLGNLTLVWSSWWSVPQTNNVYVTLSDFQRQFWNTSKKGNGHLCIYNFYFPTSWHHSLTIEFYLPVTFVVIPDMLVINLTTKPSEPCLVVMTWQTMVAEMKVSITGTQNSH